MKSKW